MDRIDAIMDELRTRTAATAPEGRAGAAARDRPRRSAASDAVPSPSVHGSRLRAVAVRHRRAVIAVAAAIVAMILVPSIVQALRAAPAAPPVAPKAPVAPAPSPDMSGTPAPAGWQAIVEVLDARRGRAIVQADPSLLAEVAAEASPARTTDASLIATLRAQRWHASGYPMRVVSVREQYVTQGEAPARALVTVVDELGAYDILDAQGRPVQHLSGRGRVTWNVELRNTESHGWLFVSARRVTPAKR